MIFRKIQIGVNVVAGIRGRLIELNDQLIGTPFQMDLSVIEKKVGRSERVD